MEAGSHELLLSNIGPQRPGQYGRRWHLPFRLHDLSSWLFVVLLRALLRFRCLCHSQFLKPFRAHTLKFTQDNQLETTVPHGSRVCGVRTPQRKNRLIPSHTDFQVTDRLPNITFNIGRTFAGNLPVQRANHPNNTLFFIGVEKTLGSLTAPLAPANHNPWGIWLNGGSAFYSFEKYELASLILPTVPDLQACMGFSLRWVLPCFRFVTLLLKVAFFLRVEWSHQHKRRLFCIVESLRLQ